MPSAPTSPAPAPPAPAPARQPPGSSGVHGGARYVVYEAEVRYGGTKAWRNNNPGNIVGGSFANGHGAIGTAFGMAVFPDEATRLAALYALLHSASYQARTIRQAITTYAPPGANDTEGYIRDVVRGAGVPDTTRLSALDDAQLDLVVGVIRRVEGWQAGTPYDRSGPEWVRRLLGAVPAPPAAPAGPPPSAQPNSAPAAPPVAVPAAPVAPDAGGPDGGE